MGHQGSPAVEGVAVFWVVLGMILAVALAAFVLGVVALPARRAGRAVFTQRGERLFRVSGGPGPLAPPSERQAKNERRGDGERRTRTSALKRGRAPRS